jgi:16S rRNA (guanine966-N2)-methyltransferase
LNTARLGGWIAPQGVVVVEQSWKEPLVTPEGFQLADERRYGNARILLLLLDDAS